MSRPPNLDELTREVATADPRACVVSPDTVRRVIKRHANTGLTIPHERVYFITRGELEEIVDRAELTEAAAEVLGGLEASEQVIILAWPEVSERSEAAVALWRALFHARVHLAWDKAMAACRSPGAEAWRWISAIGPSEFGEIHAVLAQDEVLLPPGDEAVALTEFVASFLELRCFAPELLPDVFPSLTDPARLDGLLAQEIDAEALMEATRPGDAPWPRGEQALEPEVEYVPEVVGPPEAQGEPQARRGLARARQGLERGNAVRAALLAHRASQEPSCGPEGRALAQEAIAALGGRLVAALGEAAPTRDRWVEALLPLLDPACQGIGAVESRLLFDLQKVCLEHERATVRIDVVGWARSLGRRPMTQALDRQRLVLRVRHLRRARGRLAETRLGTEAQRLLTRALADAVAAAEVRVRGELGPLIADTLHEVGLSPHNLPERVARRKLVDGLLDRLLDRGFLNMGDLRDALSRSPLKLPDLSSPADLFGGDELLRANELLRQRLDGAWRAGEVYLRWLQRLSALAFGTVVGRWLTRHLVLPFGGAWMALSGLDHIVGPLVSWMGGAAPKLLGPGTVAALGAVLWALLHLSWAQRAATALWQGIKRLARLVFVEWPAWLLARPRVVKLLKHPISLAIWRFGVKPLGVSSVLAWALPAAGAPVVVSTPVAVVLFLGANLLLNSRPGRRIEDLAVAWLVGNWRRLTTRLLPGAIELAIDTSRRALDRIERVLYTVDEWLRFQRGDSPWSRGVKAAGGLAWGLVAYIVRLYVTLLIEPQINPIKHFPVVTVSHKIILPFSLKLTVLMATPLAFLGPVLSNTIAGATVFLLPGVFGFLVWEFKENWRLYRANRPRRIEPAWVGPHGETMARLLRPGFHSGTVPRLFGKLRRADRSRSWKAARKHREALHHVEHAAALFVERDFVALLRAARIGGQGGALGVGEVSLASNRINVEITRQGAARPMLLRFEEQDGWLVCAMVEEGWLGGLEGAPREAALLALEGFFEVSGADLRRADLKALVPAGTPYALARGGVRLWPGGDFQVEVRYDLRQRPTLQPSPPEVAQAHGLAEVPAVVVLRSERPLTWGGWVERWAGWAASSSEAVAEGAEGDKKAR